MSYENCEGCGSPILILHNDSDREYWYKCEDCGHEKEITKEEFEGAFSQSSTKLKGGKK